MPRAAPQSHPRTIVDDGGHPGKPLRLPLELIEVLVSGDECFLNGIFRVGRISQQSIGTPVERRQTVRENVFHFVQVSFTVVKRGVLFTAGVGLCRLHVSLPPLATHQKARGSPIDRWSLAACFQWHVSNQGWNTRTALKKRVLRLTQSQHFDRLRLSKCGLQTSEPSTIRCRRLSDSWNWSCYELDGGNHCDQGCD